VPIADIVSEFLGLAAFLVPLGLLGSATALFMWRRLAASQASLPALLRAALRRNEVTLAYQPIVDLRTGNWVGAEALARWHRPNGEWVSPEIFVPIAERHGLITQLTDLVIAVTVEDMARTLRRYPGFFVSVNISATDLRRPGLADQLEAALRRNRLDSSALHIELTEREIIDQPDDTAAITELRRRGFKVGTDDFGIGYSSLAYLDALEVDYIKIDRSFVANALTSEPRAEVIHHLIELAHLRHLEIVAEGVERQEQVAYLLSQDVTLGQGWLYGRPMRAAQFEEELRSKAAAPRPLAVAGGDGLLHVHPAA
jgi:sensor c-di-GMP phosphodiesterase-like protein